MSGRWGWTGKLDKCSEGATRANVVEDVIVVSFMDSLYGFASSFVGGPTIIIPYLVDEATLEIDVRPDLAIDDPNPPGTNSASRSPCVMDDSTMVLTGNPVNTVPSLSYDQSLYVLTRSGLSLSISGPQATISTGSVVTTVTYLDSTHVVVMDEVPRTSPGFFIGNRWRTFEVSGGGLSLLSTHDFTLDVTIPGSFIVTDDAGGAPFGIDRRSLYPFQYHAGVLYVYTFSAPAGALAIIAVPFTPSGGMTGSAIGLTTRGLRVHQGSAATIAAAKTDSSECILYSTGDGGRATFYDDGSHMHAPGLTLPSPDYEPYHSSMSYIGYQGLFEASRQMPFGDYLTAGGLTNLYDSGSTIGPSLVTQSGNDLSAAPISAVFSCPVFGTDVGQQLAARHTSNVAVQSIPDPFDFDFFDPPFNRLIRAFKW